MIGYNVNIMTDDQYDKLYNRIVDVDKRQEERLDALMSYLDKMVTEFNQKIDNMADADTLDGLIEKVERRIRVSS